MAPPWVGVPTIACRTACRCVRQCVCINTITLLLTLTSVLTSPSLQLPNSCLQSLAIVVGDNSCTRINQSDIQSNGTVQWQCPDLQSALVAAAGFNHSSLDTVENFKQQNCISIAVPPGNHSLSAPVQFNNASVSVFGTGGEPDDVTIVCNYSVDVNESRIYDMDYDYTDYTFYFNRSEVVSFESVQFVGCPYPLRLDTVATVRVRNSIFR